MNGKKTSDLELHLARYQHGIADDAYTFFGAHPASENGQDGYRFRFILNGSTVQVEVYSYDVNNLNEQGQTVLDSVKAEGSFTMLDNDVPATLNSDGKYMLLYTDGSTSAENTAQRERVLQLFEAFKVDN